MSRPSSHLRVVTTPHEPPIDPESSVEPFTDIFHRYSRYIAAIALRILGQDEEVDDVVQDVFLEALHGLRRLRDPSALKGWLATVAVRCASRRLRRRRLRTMLGLGSVPGYENLPGTDASPEHQVLLRQVYGILDRIPVRDRVAWVLRYIEGEGLDEVARLCGCSLATAKRRIAAAHQVVEKGLGHESSRA